MKTIGGILLPFRRRAKKIKVYALVGETGTGKSFRARLVAEKHNIELMVDDGLLIRDQRILGGKSAKREKNRFTAIRRALFEDPEQTDEVKKALENEKFSSILIIGTSEKMVGKIVDKLELPYPDQIIYIEDVATREEIARAKEVRHYEGKHIIPVPKIEVKKDPSQYILDSIKIFLKNHRYFFWKKQLVEKTIVQPHFSRRGRLSISEAALSQMIMHCIQEYNKILKINKIIIDTKTNDYRIEVRLTFPFGINIPETLVGVQEYIITNFERFSGIHIEKLHLTVNRIEKR